MKFQEEILAMVQQVKLPPGETLPPGIGSDEIDAFSRRTRLHVPPELTEWLKICNGPCFNPEGTYGIGVSRKILDIESKLKLKPEYLSLGWIPLAGDGCGDYYLVATKEEYGPGYPVFFIDHEIAYDQPRYIVASSIAHFLRFYLEESLGAYYWPFTKDKVLEKDPDICGFHGIRLPWDAD